MYIYIYKFICMYVCMYMYIKNNSNINVSYKYTRFGFISTDEDFIRYANTCKKNIIFIVYKEYL